MRSKKRGPKPPGRAIWVKINERQLALLNQLDPVFGKNPGDKLLYFFQRFIEQKVEGVFLYDDEDEVDESEIFVTDDMDDPDTDSLPEPHDEEAYP